ncbi:hypothetical protein CDAR_175641 [Caerostris darwini]|uniref:Uncharacterized protein n=1 Tax=Caerostris darwini TaxID=1538125 RepID=A0AAV4X5H3_9ARAC|nr:hypothetical protein CDAR_175641 [Caerostris darwini]
MEKRALTSSVDRRVQFPNQRKLRLKTQQASQDGLKLRRPYIQNFMYSCDCDGRMGMHHFKRGMGYPG